MSEMFEVRGARPNAGISKSTGKPYKFVAFSGFLTNAQGEVSCGEVVLFEYENRPIPQIEIGKVYSLSYSSRVKQGKIEASTPQLTLVK